MTELQDLSNRNALESLVTQLRDVNRHLVVATIEAQIKKDETEAAIVALQQARLEIEAGLARYTDLYDFAPAGYVTLERDGTLIQVNQTSARMLGVRKEQLMGRGLTSRIALESRQTFSDFLLRVFSAPGKSACEVKLQRADGEFLYFSIEAFADPFCMTCRAILEEITLRKEAEQRMASAKESLEIRVLERTTELLEANGRLHAEIDVRKRVETALRDTEKKLRALARHQLSVKEGERKRIAREIHDELGQTLLVLKIDVTMLHTRTDSSHKRLHARTATALEHIDGMVRSVKQIINDLRPHGLELGLQIALEFQISEFRRRTGIACELVFEGKDIDSLIGTATATGLFRIVQESLSNIVRHAHATRTSVSLVRTDGKLIVKVADNGVGIDPACRRQAHSFGLIGIEERVSMIGGTLTIGNGSDGAGTELVITIPI
ncbi:hypothetical protein BH11PSE11_BH11PSE11_27790 [soil metagenome]